MFGRIMNMLQHLNIGEKAKNFCSNFSNWGKDQYSYRSSGSHSQCSGSSSLISMRSLKKFMTSAQGLSVIAALVGVGLLIGGLATGALPVAIVGGCLIAVGGGYFLINRYYQKQRIKGEQELREKELREKERRDELRQEITGKLEKIEGNALFSTKKEWSLLKCKYTPYELIALEKIPNIFVKNINNKEITILFKEPIGEFSEESSKEWLYFEMEGLDSFLDKFLIEIEELRRYDSKR